MSDAMPEERARNGAGSFHRVALRAYPDGYRAACTICSDFDETPDWQTYRESARYLNTTASTRMGEGLGLEIGNSIYFWPTFHDKTELAYWTTDDAGRAMVQELIHSGHIDTLHSFGHLARDREDAQRALDELERHDCRLRLWVDHASAPHNFGPDIMKGNGDVPGAAPYHADLTAAYGIKYVWRGRVTSVIGQDAPYSVGGLLDPAHPLASAKTVAKELTKGVLGRCGKARWRLNSTNRLLHRSRLRDGRPVYELLRCNPYWRGVQHAATADGIAEVITDPFLDRLVAREGTCVIYTHLGKTSAHGQPFTAQTCAALRRLAERYHAGQIMVTTTARLLDYVRVRDGLRWSAHRTQNGVSIELLGLDDHVDGFRPPRPEELAGLTFVLDGTFDVCVRLPDGAAVDARVRKNGASTIASVPWNRLVFPDL